MNKRVLCLFLVAGLEMPSLIAGGWFSRQEDSSIDVDYDSSWEDGLDSAVVVLEDESTLSDTVEDREFFNLVTSEGCPVGAMFAYLAKYPNDLEYFIALKPCVISLFFFYLTQVNEADRYSRIGVELWPKCEKILYPRILECLESHPELVPMACEVAKSDRVQSDLANVLASSKRSCSREC